MPLFVLFWSTALGESQFPQYDEVVGQRYSFAPWSHKNRRSLVSLTNLMDMLITVASHPAAANQVFLVSDGEDLSTTGLLRRMAAAMGKRANLLPVPESLLKTAALLLGKKSVGQRLCGSLQVDISKNKQLLDWNPPLSVDQGLQRVAEYYLEYR